MVIMEMWRWTNGGGDGIPSRGDQGCKAKPKQQK
jgi:hypothetical protein